jgi:alpha/beta superfamily hydrolase
MPADLPVTIPGAGVTLEGSLRLPEVAGPFGGIAVCHPHPRYGGSMENNVAWAIAQGAVEAGVAALRFNFRGVGASTGRYDGGNGEQEDARAALEWLSARPGIDAGRLGLAGYSFGAIVAAKVADAGVAALVLVAPAADRPEDPLPWLADYPGPVLVLAGDEDPYCPVEGLRALAARLGPRAELEVLHRVDHFWGGDEPQIVRKAGAFFALHLARPGEESQ